MRSIAGKRFIIICVLISIVALAGLQSPLRASAAPDLQAATTFWPLPARHSGLSSWWAYSWTDGPQTLCSGLATRQMYIGASYLNDGAFGDTITNDSDLLSLSFFKSDPCTYWWPGQDKVFRWYSSLMVTSPTRIYDTGDSSTYADAFLSFRGHSEWMPYRGGTTTDLPDPDRTTTDFYDPDGTLHFRVNGRYTINIDPDGSGPQGLRLSYLGGYKFAYDNQVDDTPFPNYAAIPNRMISADVLVSRNPAYRLFVPVLFTQATHAHVLASSSPAVATTRIRANRRYYRYFENNWNGQRNSGVAAESTSYAKFWAMFIRKTSLIWEGKPVLYVGFSEGDDTAHGPTGTTACEEWWFAQDIGPIYIAAYPSVPLATCRDTYLAANQQLQAGAGLSPAYNNPEAYLGHNPNLVGYLKQVWRCIIPNCGITY